MPHQWYRVATTNLIVGARDLLTAMAVDTGYIGGIEATEIWVDERAKTGYV
jgi:hypothetical protein